MTIMMNTPNTPSILANATQGYTRPAVYWYRRSGMSSYLYRVFSVWPLTIQGFTMSKILMRLIGDKTSRWGIPHE